MSLHEDLSQLLTAIVMGIEPIPDAVLRRGGATPGEIDLSAYERSAFDCWDCWNDG